MARRYAVDLTEVFEIIHGHFVAEKVKERVLQHAPVAIGQHKAVSVQPIWILRVEGHEFVKEDVGDRRHAHRRTWVAGVGLEGGIDLS